MTLLFGPTRDDELLNVIKIMEETKVMNKMELEKLYSCETKSSSKECMEIRTLNYYIGLSTKN